MPGLGIGPGTAFRQDILAARPPAVPSLQGYFFFATDVDDGTLYQCTGSGWIQVAPGVNSNTLVAGTNISLVPGSGTITINNTYTLPIASGSQLGGIKVGAGLTISVDGRLDVIDVPVQHNGTLVGDEAVINFIDGANVTITATDDPVNHRTNVEIAASGGGGGTPLNHYEQVVMTDTPLAFWPLTESGTETTDTYADITGNGFDLHPRLGTAQLVAAFDGYFRHTPGMFSGQTAPYFGTNHFQTTEALYTTNTAGLPYGSTPFTLEAWVQGNRDAYENTEPLIQYGKIRFTGGFAPRMLSVQGEGGSPDNPYPYTFIEANAGSTDLGDIFRDHNVLDGNWNHVVFSYDPVGGTAKRYLNGTLLYTNTGLTGAQLSHTVSDVLFIGDAGRDASFNYTTPIGQPFIGSISHPAIYSHVLTDAQVANHYEAALETGLQLSVIAVAFSDVATTFANNTARTVPFPITQVDMGTSLVQHSTLANTDSIIVRETGWYEVTGRLVFQDGSFGGTTYPYGLTVYIGHDPDPLPFFFLGRIADKWEYDKVANGDIFYINLRGYMYLEVGNVVKMIIYQNSGVTQNIYGLSFFDEYMTRLGIRKIDDRKTPWAGVFMHS